jgi:hypothetical protein
MSYNIIYIKGVEKFFFQDHLPNWGVVQNFTRQVGKQLAQHIEMVSERRKKFSGCAGE